MWRVAVLAAAVLKFVFQTLVRPGQCFQFHITGQYDRKPEAAVQYTGCTIQFTRSSKTIHRMRNYRSPDAQLQITGCATTDRRMRNYRSPDAQLQITGCARSRAETLPQAPRRSCGKKKNIGNIWGSNWTYDVNFIFWWSVPLNMYTI